MADPGFVVLKQADGGGGGGGGGGPPRNTRPPPPPAPFPPPPPPHTRGPPIPLHIHPYGGGGGGEPHQQQHQPNQQPENYNQQYQQPQHQQHQQHQQPQQPQQSQKSQQSQQSQQPQNKSQKTQGPKAEQKKKIISTGISDVNQQRSKDDPQNYYKDLTTFEVVILRKADSSLKNRKPTWQRVMHAQESIPQDEIIRTIKHLNRQDRNEKHKTTVTSKLSKLYPHQGEQVNRILDDRTNQEIDGQFEWTICQMDKSLKISRNGFFSTKKETKTITLFLQRAPRRDLDIVTIWNNVQSVKRFELLKIIKDQQPQEVEKGEIKQSGKEKSPGGGEGGKDGGGGGGGGQANKGQEDGRQREPQGGGQLGGGQPSGWQPDGGQPGGGQQRIPPPPHPSTLPITANYKGEGVIGVPDPKHQGNFPQRKDKPKHDRGRSPRKDKKHQRYASTSTSSYLTNESESDSNHSYDSSKTSTGTTSSDAHSHSRHGRPIYPRHRIHDRHSNQRHYVTNKTPQITYIPTHPEVIPRRVLPQRAIAADYVPRLPYPWERPVLLHQRSGNEVYADEVHASRIEEHMMQRDAENYIRLRRFQRDISEARARNRRRGF